MHLTQELDKAIAQVPPPTAHRPLSPTTHSCGKFVVFAPDCQIKYLAHTAKNVYQELK